MSTINKNVILALCLLGATQVNAAGTFARAAKNLVISPTVLAGAAASGYMYQLGTEKKDRINQEKIDTAQTLKNQVLEDENKPHFNWHHNLYYVTPPNWVHPKEWYKKIFRPKTIDSKTIDIQDRWNKHSKN
ncbi:MAG: hypothetical protein ACJAZS_000350, partial [Alteromonas naphthalenivorans]